MLNVITILMQQLALLLMSMVLGAMLEAKFSWFQRLIDFLSNNYERK